MGVKPFPPHLLPNLLRALAETDGCHDVAAIENLLAAGFITLWERGTSFVLTELKQAPTGKRYAHIFLAGGQMEDMMPVECILEAWARSQGCVAMTMTGRRGWERSFLKDRGWMAPHTMYRKELV